MTSAIKKFNTIGCCGIDCGLCPRFISKSISACPGCGSNDFQDKHPSCGFLTCCANKRGFEVCAECKEYPCKRFNPEKEGYDSFVTHQKIFENQEQIKANGFEPFMAEQKLRIEILNYLIENFDNGKSKSFFCQAITLLPLQYLFMIQEKSQLTINSPDKLQKNKEVVVLIKNIANEAGINLKLRKKGI